MANTYTQIYLHVVFAVEGIACKMPAPTELKIHFCSGIYKDATPAA